MLYLKYILQIILEVNNNNGIYLLVFIVDNPVPLSHFLSFKIRNSIININILNIIVAVFTASLLPAAIIVNFFVISFFSEIIKLCISYNNSKT